MFFIFSKVLEFLIYPLNWIIFLFTLSLIIKKKTLQKRLLLAAFFSLLFFTNSLPIYFLSKKWNIKSPRLNELNKKYEVGVVLGGFLKTVKNEPNSFYIATSGDRLLKAIQLKKAGKINRIFISGGSGKVLAPEFEEGKIAVNFLNQLCIDKNLLMQESKSRNTYENALFTKDALDSMRLSQDKILLITSSYHMRRSLACFRKQGLNVDPFVSDPQGNSGIDWRNPSEYLLPNAENLNYWDTYLHEWVGFVIYKLAGYA